LKDLCNDFENTVKSVTKILVQERNLPAYERVFKPLTLDSNKYIVHGILYAFTEDRKIGDYWLYGIRLKSDYFAMKAFSGEVRNSRALYKIILNNNLNLRIPLNTIIHYLGYSIFATSLIPVTKDSLLYGSSTTGFQIFTNERAFPIVEYLSQSYGLGEHLVFDQQSNTKKKIKLAVDVELHEIDGAFYIKDFIRLFPPSNSSFPLSTFFRPEYLIKNPNLNISCDSFSGFGVLNGEEENKKTINAIYGLREYVKNELVNLLIDENNLIDQNNLTSNLHSHGFNLCDLGVLRNALSNKLTDDKLNDDKKSIINRLIQIITLEMVLRSIKTVSRFQLKKKCEETYPIIKESPLKKELLHLYHNILNKDEETWKSILKMIDFKYEKKHVKDIVLTEKLDFDTLKIYLPKYLSFDFGSTENDIILHPWTKSFDV